MFRLLFPLFWVTATLSAELAIYDFPAEMPRSSRFEAKVGPQSIPALQTQRGAFLNFGMTDPVEVEVSLKTTPKSAVIRPL
ncbi:MAG: hypothetical protein ACPG4K_15010, partial [Haloferula sp.]